ncbi:acyl-CoA thioesterase/BAAT N-terminal domain-containing protein [Dictyobacter kobayashii]|uniref:Acyl-CoA thioester hydrolase/bile acid-CoA amino acid N-acetyltransferase domain-containing protein n=1 Tax=Dictyobacter kobayashii TaxID=2014872 RepID=A0A402AW02_9CHLR|nr:acyl-CoA thioesterase/BAAT N-terminal domain-containing protein [Dictyobacter kobayashii]GCE23311.1 hypothetical protein KDK_71110 [Dictyobacter kobayashii]
MDKATEHHNIQISIEPPQAQIDRKIDIQLSHLPPWQEITLSAKTQDDNGITWQATATFQANERGTIQVGSQRPLKGTYQPM